MSTVITAGDVRAAAERLRGWVLDTPFLHSRTLSEIVGAEIWLKFENLQFTGSFKQRGALNRLLLLSAPQRRAGVIAASAGNHGQGLAYHAYQLGIPTTIVMPLDTPSVKVGRTRAFGAEVILTGRSFQEAADAVSGLVEARGLTLVHPYDDPAVIAGQGTIAVEIAASGVALDALLVPVGGGGLMAGIAVAMQQERAGVEVIGVESERYPSMALALSGGAGSIVGGSSVAEGIAVARPGRHTTAILRALGARIRIVPEARIEEGVALLLQIEKTLVEGAGAAGLAALLEDAASFRGRRIGLILTGGNIDNRLLLTIMQRQLVREGRLLRLAVPLADQAGALARLCTAIGELGGNINTVSHDRTFVPRDAKSVQVLVELEVPDPASGAKLLAHLAELGMQATELNHGAGRSQAEPASDSVAPGAAVTVAVNSTA